MSLRTIVKQSINHCREKTGCFGLRLHKDDKQYVKMKINKNQKI